MFRLDAPRGISPDSSEDILRAALGLSMAVLAPQGVLGLRERWQVVRFCAASDWFREMPRRRLRWLMRECLFDIRQYGADAVLQGTLDRLRPDTHAIALTCVRTLCDEMGMQLPPDVHRRLDTTARYASVEGAALTLAPTAPLV